MVIDKGVVVVLVVVVSVKGLVNPSFIEDREVMKPILRPKHA